jgi:hypothetical protein
MKKNITIYEGWLMEDWSSKLCVDEDRLEDIFEELKGSKGVKVKIIIEESGEKSITPS